MDRFKFFTGSHRNETGTKHPKRSPEETGGIHFGSSHLTDTPVLKFIIYLPEYFKITWDATGNGRKEMFYSALNDCRNLRVLTADLLQGQRNYSSFLCDICRNDVSDCKLLV